MKLRLLLLALWVLSISGCSIQEGNSRNDAETRLIPELFLECNLGQSLNCGGTGQDKIFYVGLLNDTSLDCEDELTKVTSASNFRFFFDASGTAAGTFVANLTGEVTEWVDASGQTAATITNSDIKACAFLDSDGDETLGSDETVGSLIIGVDEDSGTMTDWF